MKIVIDHIAGSRRGQRQEFDIVGLLRFGRHPENDVSFDAHRDLDASSRHAELQRRGEEFFLCDVGSSNGTFVEGSKIGEVKVAPGQPVEVEFGAGGPRLRVFIGRAEEIPVPPTLPADAMGPPSTLAAGQRPMGNRTIAMMLRAAADDAGAKHGIGRPTQFVKSLVDQALHRSSRRFKIILVAIAVGVTALVAGLIYWQMSERSRMRAENQARLEELRLQTGEISRSQLEGVGPRIASSYGAAVYLLVVQESAEDTHGFCTGFAINDHQLATNAHCVVEVGRFHAGEKPVFAMRSGGGVPKLKVGDAVKHARYRGGLTEDVGVVTVEGKLEVMVKLATMDRLHALQKGANVFTLGFPGRLAKRMADAEAPEATIVNGIIGRVTNFKGVKDKFENELLVQHNLLTSPGTSGSPVFDGYGDVIAVNAGSYTEARLEVLVDPVTGEKKELAQNVLTPGANYAIRIDALLELVRDNGIEIPDASSPGGEKVP